MKHLSLKIIGKVQGVFFRKSAEEKAKKLGLTGWARNNSDGSVSIEVEGERDALVVFYKWSYQGPSSSKVKKVYSKWSDRLEGYEDFEIVG